jgi:hypothetical protein
VNRRSGPTQRQARLTDPLEDAVSSVVQYARQETVGPLRGAGRWLVFGMCGAILVGAATVMGVLAALRLVQDLSGGALDGAWSFVPYLVAFVAAVSLTAVSLSRIGGSELNKRAFEEGDHG